MTPHRRTCISATIWLCGVALCVVFVGLLLPMGGPPDHRWVFPLGARGILFFGGGCCLILFITYLADKYLTNGKNPN
jgi:hypothetical protein